MTKILSDDKKHAILSSAYYSEIVNCRNQMSMTTEAVTGEPTSVYCAKSHAYYYNKFLPKKH